MLKTCDLLSMATLLQACVSVLLIFVCLLRCSETAPEPASYEFNCSSAELNRTLSCFSDFEGQIVEGCIVNCTILDGWIDCIASEKPTGLSGACLRSIDNSLRHLSKEMKRYLTIHKGVKQCVITLADGVYDGTFCPNAHTVITDGAWSSWSDWSVCSVSCGSGNKKRIRTCDNPSPSWSGLGCTPVGEDSELVNCVLNPDPHWLEWSTWSACLSTCGAAQRTRMRTCLHQAEECGTGCAGSDKEAEQCSLHDCPRDGAWSEWTAWTGCTVTCETGSRSRQRACDKPSPTNGGLQCTGNSTELGACTEPLCPVQGAWGLWSEYGSCSVTCGEGQHTRTRECDNPTPLRGGNNCSGDSTESEACSVDAVDGGWTVWVESSCSQTCGDGHITRTRSCTKPEPSGCGQPCQGDDRDTQPCSPLAPCPVDGGWSPWNHWSTCSVSCGSGSQTRTRVCDNPASAHAGADCLGDATNATTCTLLAVAGVWSGWGSWTSCSHSCGGTGVKVKQRTCTDPAPARCGQECSGPDVAQEPCVSLGTCGNGGTCTQQPGDTSTCVCAQGFVGWQCRGSVKADVHAVLADIQPSYGPIAGGTLITLTGTNLDLYPTDKVKLGTITCSALNWSSQVVQVTSSPVTQPAEDLPVSLFYAGGLQVVTRPTFSYRPNPTIIAIHPLAAIASGGITLTVEGTHLTSVATPEIVATIFENKEGILTEVAQFFEVCNVTNAENMFCPSPIIDSTQLGSPRFAKRKKRSMPLDEIERSMNMQLDIGYSPYSREATNIRRKRQAPETEAGFYVAQLGFRLDGLDDYNDLSNHPSLSQYAQLTVYTTLEITPFIEGYMIYSPDHDSHITIDGQNMDKGLRIGDYTVEVGQGHCDVIELHSNVLRCKPPDESPAKQHQASVGPETIVRVGYISHHLGYLKYNGGGPTALIAGTSAAAGAVILAIIIVVIVLFARGRHRPEVSASHSETYPNDRSRKTDDYYDDDKNADVIDTDMFRSPTNNFNRNGYNDVPDGHAKDRNHYVLSGDRQEDGYQAAEPFRGYSVAPFEQEHDDRMIRIGSVHNDNFVQPRVLNLTRPDSGYLPPTRTAPDGYLPPVSRDDGYLPPMQEVHMEDDGQPRFLPRVKLASTSDAGSSIAPEGSSVSHGAWADDDVRLMRSPGRRLSVESGSIILPIKRIRGVNYGRPAENVAARYSPTSGMSDL